MRRNRDFVNKQGNGPLLTDHLRDLDMELELLKRKREILQQEQHMITRISRQNYEQPSSSFRQMNHEIIQYQPSQVEMSNFADIYEPQPRNFRQGLKRPNQSNWQTSNPKRFNSAHINPWQNDIVQPQRQYQQPKQRFSSAQLMSAKPGIGRRMKRENPNPKARKDNAKAKPKPVIVSHVIKEAKNLVSETKTSQPNDQILLADRQPSLQMKGRMELALGSILKELRQDLTSDPDVSEYFATHYIQRIVKRTVRSRIRDVMMGKAIGTINDILENYRKTYPKETDIEILATVKEAEALSSKNLSVTHLIESDDPQDFFKRNMMRVLSNKLDDLFSNLQQFYVNRDAQIIEGINKLPEPQTSSNPKQADDPNEKVNLQQMLNKFFESVPDDNELVKALGGRIDKAKHYIDFMDKLIEEKLPKVLPKFKDVIINILYHDREFIGAKAMVMTEMKKKVTAQNGTEQKKTVKTIGDQGAKKDEDKPMEQIKDGDKPMEQIKDTPVVETVQQKEKENATERVEKEQLYYVKLIGRPKLPARAVICEFLNKYNTKSIKKHKTINNLLVLAFDNKADYEMILQASETVIDDATIIIKASEQVVMNKDANQKTSQKKDESLNSSNNKKLDNSSDKNNQQDFEESGSVNDKNNDNIVTFEKPVEDKITESNDIVEGNDKTSDNNDVVKGNDEIAESNDIVEGNDKTSDNNEVVKGNDEIADTKDMEGKNKTGENDKVIVKAEDNIKYEIYSMEEVRSNASDETLQLEDAVTKTEMDIQDYEILNEEQEIKNVILNTVEELKVSGRSTPVRFSPRLANAPSNIKTRRASRLTPNNS